MARAACAAVAAVLLATASPIALGQDSRTTLSVGADYSTGKFGQTQATDLLYVPVTGKHEAGLWIFKLVVPYIHITGPGNVVGSADSVVILPGGNAALRTENGIGDVVASAFYNVFNENSAPLGLDLGAKVKFGTADESRGLGTGKTDYALQADLFKPIGALTVFGSVGYRWYGDPEGVDLQNTFYGAIGASHKVSRPTTVGLVYDGRGRISPGGGKVSELTLFGTYAFSSAWKLQVYGVKGFSDASPDAAGGAVLSYSF
jgi:Putative MetA-pathway of phenol degradation